MLPSPVLVPAVKRQPPGDVCNDYVEFMLEFLLFRGPESTEWHGRVGVESKKVKLCMRVCFLRVATMTGPGSKWEGGGGVCPVTRCTKAVDLQHLALSLTQSG